MLQWVHSFHRKEVAGTQFDFALKDQVVHVLAQWRCIGRRSYIAIVNPHSVMMCHRDRGMRQAVAGAGLTLPDGVGIIVAGKVLGYGRRHRVTGPALMLQLCDQGRELGLRHFFYGGSPGIAEKLVKNLSGQFPGIQIAGTFCPPFRTISPQEDARIVKQINETRPDVVWVGLGAPKQEKWMAAHVGKIEATAMVGVGAAFDFHSGNVPWAPSLVRKCGMEWAWRLACEPGRMLRRNLDTPLFLLAVAGQAVRDRVGALAHRATEAFSTKTAAREELPPAIYADVPPGKLHQVAPEHPRRPARARLIQAESRRGAVGAAEPAMSS